MSSALSNAKLLEKCCFNLLAAQPIDSLKNAITFFEELITKKHLTDPKRLASCQQILVELQAAYTHTDVKQTDQAVKKCLQLLDAANFYSTTTSSAQPEFPLGITLKKTQAFLMRHQQEGLKLIPQDAVRKNSHDLNTINLHETTNQIRRN